jgi:hypothetical protein
MPHSGVRLYGGKSVGSGFTLSKSTSAPELALSLTR